MKTIGTLFMSMLLVLCGQTCVSGSIVKYLEDAVAIDSVSLYFKPDLDDPEPYPYEVYVKFIYCHPGYYSTMGYGLESDSIALVKSIDFVSPLEADVPKRISYTLQMPVQWMRYNDRMRIVKRNRWRTRPEPARLSGPLGFAYLVR